MKKLENFAQLHAHRELDSRYASVIQKQLMVAPEFIKRLGLYGELDGHTGCVNTLEWSQEGRILASGSDDVHVCLWDPFRKKQLASIATGHHGNVFTVKFIPNTGNRTLVSGAADNSVRIHDVVAKDIIGICTCHTNRVKRCATDPISPNLFFSGGEDGVVIQHDLRTSHTCPTSDSKKSRNILIDLRKYIGKAEVKCIAISPVSSNLLSVGANDPYVRIFDRRMIKMIESEGSSVEWETGIGAVQYFVPGHLPPKITEYKRKYRSLASTYLTFSPDGKELLVNLGGEQIYLFPLTEDPKTDTKCFSIPEPVTSTQVKDHHENGYSNGYKNGATISSSFIGDYQLFRGMRPIRKPKEKIVLSPSADSIKGKANECFEGKDYIKAVHLYNEALSICPHSPVLYGNRAAALLKRSWDGDIYAALKDCQTAIFLDPDHFKALLRLGRCLFELKRLSEATSCLTLFRNRFPDHTHTAVYKSLDDELSRALAAESIVASQLAAKKAEKKPSVNNNDSPSTSGSSSSGQQNTAAAFLRQSADYVFRFRRNSGEGDGADESANGGDEDDDSSVDNEELSVADSNRTRSSDSNSSSPIAADLPKPVGSKKPDLYEYEATLRDKAVDFSERYCGHCNTTTDIKEANFFGDRWIVAGSDDGKFFIWDRKTTNIVKILKGDESIVNCLQPHPNTCMLATSGIESVVRLWTPMPEEGFVNDRVVIDVNEAAFENQKRMKSNPFEVILMNMGYRIGGAEDEASDENASREAPMPCNPS